jgi:outer membrane receptor protein involved in Fe transport
MGASLDGGRGNVALSFGFTNTSPLRQDARTIGKVSRSSTSGNPQGSFTTVPVFIDLGDDGFQIDPATGAPSAGLETFNFNPDNYYQTPLKRTQFTALGNYVFNDHAEAYSQLFFTRADVGSQLAPSGTFFNDYLVPLGNPYLTPAVRQAICNSAQVGLTPAECADDTREVLLPLGRRFVELGPRLNNFKNTTFQWTAGMRGTIVDSWSYDAYASLGKSDQLQTRGNWGSYSKVQQALRALSTTDCLDSSNGCVPLNVFGAAGSITPEMARFINLDAVLTQQVEQKIYSASVTGDLGNATSPFSNRPISLALGVESRSVSAGNKSDASTQINGEVLGTGAPQPDRAGDFKLTEFFGESVIPLLNGRPLAERLDLELGYRQTKFTTTSSQNYGTYKMGTIWEPSRGLRVRAMQQRATRAPNVDELYAPLVTSLDNLAADPCQGTNINSADANTPGTISNLCRLTGVPLSAIGGLSAPSAGQVNILSGGNPDLKPEKADTTTIGFILQPASIPGLAVSVDHWRIKVKDAVSNPAVDDILTGCYSTASNPNLVFNADCAKVGRNPATGTFNGASAPGVLLETSNLGTIETSGWDIGVSYGFSLQSLGADPKLGRIDLEMNASVLDKYLFKASPTSVNRDCVGYYSVACGTVSEGEGPINKTKWNQRTTWTMGDWATSVNWRHLSGVKHETGIANPVTGARFFTPYTTIKSFDYFDLGINWKPTKSLRVSLSVNNLFDKKPPEVGNTIGSTSANSGNTFPQTYDVIGRYYTLGAALKF